MKVCYIDHYDSFSHNLIDCLFSDTDCELVYIEASQLKDLGELWSCKMPVILSPGPNRPESNPWTIKLVKRLLGKVPILGVCLGHQCLGYAVGGKVIPAVNPFHGKRTQISLTQKLQELPLYPDRFWVAQYNSLVLAHDSLGREQVWATNEEGEIQGLILKEYGGFTAWGVQFHPESFLSDHKDSFRSAWLKMVLDYYKK